MAAVVATRTAMVKAWIHYLRNFLGWMEMVHRTRARTTRFRTPIHFMAAVIQTHNRKYGLTGYAIHGASPSISRPAIFTSEMLGRIDKRKWTFNPIQVQAVRTMAGISWRAISATSLLPIA